MKTHFLSAALLICCIATLPAEEWMIPLGGTAFITKAGPAATEKITPAGLENWQDKVMGSGKVVS